MPKKHILIVKSLRDLSPKRQLLVSRKPQDEDDEKSLVASQIGNTSPSVSKSALYYSFILLFYKMFFNDNKLSITLFDFS